MRAYRACVAGLFSLCFLLSACDGGGGGDEPTPVTQLPETVSVSGPPSIDTDSSAQFSSDVANPNGGLSFHWDFGDGSSSTEAAPSHQFAAPGEYEVVLTVSNEDGDTKSATFKVTTGRYAMVKDLACSGANSQGWCWQRPLPMGNTIADITFIDASTGWAVGDAGQILKTTDGGATWARQVSNVTERLTHVRFANARVGWILGHYGTLLRTTDAGETWQRQAAQASYPDMPDDPGLVVLDESRALAVIGSYAARGTIDGGETWAIGTLPEPQQVTEDGTVWQSGYYSVLKATRLGTDESTVSFDGQATEEYVTYFSMGNASLGLMLTYNWGSGESRLRRTVNGGVSWVSVASVGLPPEIRSLTLFGPQVAWVTAYSGLYRSEDAGNSWKPIALPDGVDAYGLGSDSHAKDANTFWFRHDQGYYLTTDGGAHWTWLRVDGEYNGPTGLKLNAGGWWLEYGWERIYRSQDAGASWSLAFGLPVEENPAGLSSVWFFDSSKGLAVGTGGSVFETTDGGRHWTQKALTGNDSSIYSRLQFISPSTGWMSGQWGISKTTDGGATWWSPLINGGMVYPTDFHFVDEKHGWAISQTQAMYVTSDGGQTWQPQGGVHDGWQGLRFIDSKVGVVVGAAGTILRTEDGGVTWSARPTGIFENLYRVTFVGPTGWAVGYDGAVVTSTDAGLTWSRVPVPTRQSLSDVFFTDPLHGWIVGSRGSILSTVDGGKTWAVQASGTAQSLQSAFFLDPYTGWVVGTGGAVLATANGGR